MTRYISNVDPFTKAAYHAELIALIGLLFIGTGKYSVDYLFSEKKKICKKTSLAFKYVAQPLYRAVSDQTVPNYLDFMQ